VHTIEDGIKNLHKDFGKEIGGKGVKFPSYDRLPTGILPLDIALAGGIPMGAVSIFYGVENSGKTSLALRTTASYQKRYPKKRAVWIDAENAWDEDWAVLHGVDVKNLYLFKPTTSEQAADIADEAAFSEDVGLIVVDSIAALASNDQLEKTADKVVVAGAAKPTTTMMKKIACGMTEHAKSGSPLTVIYVNQIRHKIGFVMGNPEHLPGPVYQNYQAFLKLRLTGKPILKEKISPIPIYSDHSMKIVKKKFPAIRQTAEWQMILYPHAGHKPLEVNNRKQAEHLLTELGYLEKHGTKEWLLHGEVYGTKTAAVDQAMSDYDDLLTTFVDDLLLLYKKDIEETTGFKVGG